MLQRPNASRAKIFGPKFLSKFALPITLDGSKKPLPVWLDGLPTSRRRIVLGYALATGPTQDTPDLRAVPLYAFRPQKSKENGVRILATNIPNICRIRQRNLLL